jgi:hypothetical protein
MFTFDELTRLQSFAQTASSLTFTIFILFLFTIFGAFWTFSIPCRKGHGIMELWGPTRYFAKSQRWLQHRSLQKKYACFLVEIWSGVLHAPASYLAGYNLGPHLSITNMQGALWMTTLCLTLWLGIGLGRAVIIDNQEKRAAKVGTKEEAVKKFLEDPLRSLVDGENTMPWASDRPRDIFVRSLGVTIAFVTNISIDRNARVAIIGHVAVADGFERLGIGRRLALTLRSELMWRYKVVQIEFAESSTKYESAFYPEFFSNLGAVQRETFQTRPGRGNWVWSG